jgi:hypothetical protein
MLNMKHWAWLFDKVHTKEINKEELKENKQ